MSNNTRYPHIHDMMSAAWADQCGGMESFPGEGLDMYMETYARLDELQNLEQFLSLHAMVVNPDPGVKAIRLLVRLYGGFMCSEDA